VHKLEHPTAGPYRTLGFPFRLDGEPLGPHTSAPTLGQHSRAVLAELGLAGDEVDALVAAGVVVA